MRMKLLKKQPFISNSSLPKFDRTTSALPTKPHDQSFIVEITMVLGILRYCVSLFDLFRKPSIDRRNINRNTYEQADGAARLSALATAIDKATRIISLTADQDPDLPDQLNNLGILLQWRFESMGDVDDISEAIKHRRRAVQLTPEGHVDMPVHLNNLGNSYQRRFERNGELEDITEAIKNQRRAVQLTPDGHDDKPAQLSNLGISYQNRFEHNGALDDISEAIKNQRLAVQLTPDGHANMPAWLNNLGNSYQIRFEHNGNLEDISKAIKNQRLAVQLTPDGHANMPTRLNNLGGSYYLRFKHKGDLHDISEAIESQRRAVELIPDAHANKPGHLSNLGVSYHCRFEHNGVLDDISEAIKNQRRAVQLTPDGHTKMPGHLNNLGNSYQKRFERNGDLDDISEAIKHQRRAVQLTPDGHTNKPGHLNNLGASYQRRFERNRDLDDISEAIEHQRRAIQLTPDGHADMPAWLSNLGNSYMRRSEHSKDLDDVSEAIKNHLLAVQLTPDGHTQIATRFNNLGISYQRRFEHNGDLDDISEAIKNKRRAVELTPDEHANKPGNLSNLGVSYHSLFSHNGDLDAISEAIKNKRRAVQLTPDGHADMPLQLNNLAYSYLTHFERNGDLNSLAEATSTYCQSATSSTGPPSVRFWAAKEWARLLRYSRSSSSQPLIDAYTRIIQLLSLVSGLEDTVQSRHETLVESSQLSTAAAAEALSLDRPEKALEWLIEGRCIVWNQIDQLRAPLHELRAYDQALADHFSAVSKELETAGSRPKSGNTMTLSVDDKISLEEQAGRHIKLAKEHDQLLGTIRKIPGFENFLRPKQCASIMRGLPAADTGTIVIINIHDVRCDALALIAGDNGPIHIPLPNFSYQEADRLAKGLRRYLFHHGLISRIGVPLTENIHSLPDVDLTEVLSVLWTRVIRPILECLGFSIHDESRGMMPRIWWCPTGPLAFLPIHAAGIYIANEGMPKQCLSAFAVSSYIPTVNARLTTPKVNPVETSGVLIVSQPNTPMQTHILGAADEATRVAKQLRKRGISSHTLFDMNGTVENVLTAMESFSSIHLACHASQNTTNPLKSSIYLHDGSLELSDIMKRNLPNSDFAFLSACQTSTGDNNLPEEVVHLGAGMLAAGYRSVVGTMWSISDTHGPDVAEFFYESLLENDGTTTKVSNIDGDRAASALRHATKRFRDLNPDSLHVWVPYIHIGV